MERDSPSQDARLRTTCQELQALARQALYEQELERRQVARELYEDIAQNLVALQLNLEALAQNRPGGGPGPYGPADAARLAGALLEQVRDLADRLCPPALDQLGLHPALHDLCCGYAAQRAWTVAYRGQEPVGLGAPAQACLYGVAAALLENLCRPGAQVQVRLEARPGGACLALEACPPDARYRVITPFTGRGEKALEVLVQSFAGRAALLGGRLEEHAGPGGRRDWVVQFSDHPL